MLDAILVGLRLQLQEGGGQGDICHSFISWWLNFSLFHLTQLILLVLQLENITTSDWWMFPVLVHCPAFKELFFLSTRDSMLFLFMSLQLIAIGYDKIYALLY